MEIFYLDEILEEIHKERTTKRGQKMEMMTEWRNYKKLAKDGKLSAGQEGIEPINIAMSETDRVVQPNASDAEESAKVSEAMNVQAERRERIGYFDCRKPISKSSHKTLRWPFASLTAYA